MGWEFSQLESGDDEEGISPDSLTVKIREQFDAIEWWSHKLDEESLTDAIKKIEALTRALRKRRKQEYGN